MSKESALLEKPTAEAAAKEKGPDALKAAVKQHQAMYNEWFNRKEYLTQGGDANKSYDFSEKALNEWIAFNKKKIEVLEKYNDRRDWQEAALRDNTAAEEKSFQALKDAEIARTKKDIERVQGWFEGKISEEDMLERDREFIEKQ